MPLRNRAHALFVAFTAIALTVALGASSALGSTSTWTVTPGGKYTGRPNLFSVFDGLTGQTATCGSGTSTADLRFKSGSGLSNPIGKFTAVSFTGCSSGGSSFDVTSGGLPWLIRADTYNPTGNDDVVHGSYLHVHLTLSGSGCSAVIDGTSPTADDGTVPFEWFGHDTLETRFKRGNLHVYNVSGCGGSFNDGDPVFLLTSYLIGTPLTITSP